MHSEYTPGRRRLTHPDARVGEQSVSEVEALVVTHTLLARRELQQLPVPEGTRRRVHDFTLELSKLHANDPMRLTTRDSKVATADSKELGVRVTYVVVLSLGQIIVAGVSSLPENS